MSARSPVLPTLEMVSGPLPGRLIQLDKGEFLIGRDPASDLPLGLKQVSWNHARIDRGPDGSHSIRDVGSYNSTYLDGRRLAPGVPEPLRDGSRIRICEVQLIYRIEAVLVRETQGETTTILGSLEGVGSHSVPTRPERALTVLRAVLEINRILGGTTELNVVLGRALDWLFAIFAQAECGCIVTSEPDGKLSPRATRFGAGPESPRLSRTVLDHVLREGKALLISEGEPESVAYSTDSLSRAGIRTAMCVPVVGRSGRPIGIIQLDARLRPATFSSEDLELLAAVAVPIGVVIENHRLLRERASLLAAAEVQAALLPRRRPDPPGYAFWERYQPALAVGGDYYDYIPVEAGGDSSDFGDAEGSSTESGSSPPCRRWAIALGDVAGKGLPAALMMANLRAEVRHLVRSGRTPVRVVERINRQLYDADLPGRFVTFVLVQLDAETHRLEVVNAGHMAPLIRRADGTIEEVGEDAADIPLGIERSRPFAAAAAELRPGDVLVLYTDGVNEAMGAGGELFGTAALQRAIAAAVGGAPRVGDAILRALRAHVGDRPQSDDIAIVCFGRD